MKMDLDEYFNCASGLVGIGSVIVDDSPRKIDKVIFEGNYCIIVDNHGERYMSRPEKCDKYDKEKGFLIALAKFNGFSTTEIQELIKGAIVKVAKSAKKDKSKSKSKV